MKSLLILNDAPDGSERSYNALRLALTLAKNEGEQVRVFLMGEGAACARDGQTLPNPYTKIESMLKGISARGAEIAVCGTCMDARGIEPGDLGVQRRALHRVAAERCVRRAKQRLVTVAAPISAANVSERALP